MTLTNVTAVTFLQAKTRAWSDIHAKFCAMTSGGSRSVEQLRALWKTIKRSAKENLAMDKVQLYTFMTVPGKTQLLSEKGFFLLFKWRE